VTVPVGLPTAGDAATTVKLTVTDCPRKEGDGESPVIVVTELPRMVRLADPPLVRCAPDPE
jgi:hypothetical protein